MTTEQMDWVDDERAGRHDSASRRAEQMAKVRAWGMSGVPTVLYGDPSEEELAAAHAASGNNGVLVVPEEMRDAMVALGFVKDEQIDAVPDIRRTLAEERMRGLGMIRQREETTWVNAPLEIVLDVVEKVYAPEPVDRGYDPNAVTFSEETMFKVQAAITGEGIWGQKCLDIIGAMQNRGILFRERVTDHEADFDADARGEGYFGNRVTDDPEHSHYTDRARRLCAEGDHDSAALWDRDAERVKIREHEASIASGTGSDLKLDDDSSSELATMAEEPIEERLARAYKNGLLQGLDLGHRAFQNWDHS